MRIIVALLAILLAAPVGAATNWIHQTNSTCVGEDDPDLWCTGAGTGTGDDKWHLDISRSDVKWMQICNALTLRTYRTSNVPICDVARQEDDDSKAGLNSCPTSMDGLRFPARLVDAKMIRAGDGTFDGASGIAPDQDYDKWPDADFPTDNKFNNRGGLVYGNRFKWNDNGVWYFPWETACQNFVKGDFNDRTNALAKKGEREIDKQPVPLESTVDE